MDPELSQFLLSFAQQFAQQQVPGPDPTNAVEIPGFTVTAGRTTPTFGREPEQEEGASFIRNVPLPRDRPEEDSATRFFDLLQERGLSGDNTLAAIEAGVPMDTIQQVVGFPVDTMRTANDRFGGNVAIDEAATSPFADTLRAIAEGVVTNAEDINVRTKGTPGMLSSILAQVDPAEAATIDFDVGTPTGLRQGRFASTPEPLDSAQVRGRMAETLSHELAHVFQNAAPNPLFGANPDNTSHLTKESGAISFAALMDALRAQNDSATAGRPMSEKVFMNEAIRNNFRGRESHGDVRSSQVPSGEITRMEQMLETMVSLGMIDDTFAADPTMMDRLRALFRRGGDGDEN